MDGTSFTTTLDKANDRTLLSCLALLNVRSARAMRTRSRRFLLTMIGLIGFYDLTFTAKRVRFWIRHGFPNAMRHKPCGLVGNTKHPVELVCSHTFFGSGHQVEGQN